MEEHVMASKIAEFVENVTCFEGGFTEPEDAHFLAAELKDHAELVNFFWTRAARTESLTDECRVLRLNKAIAAVDVCIRRMMTVLKGNIEFQSEQNHSGYWNRVYLAQAVSVRDELRKLRRVAQMAATAEAQWRADNAAKKARQAAIEEERRRQREEYENRPVQPVSTWTIPEILSELGLS